MSSLHSLQQSFLDLRFGMFLHFNMATFQDREWGDPRGSVEAFAPTSLDTDQWALAALSAGMRYGCLTAKHHDGFCIWPTETTGDRIQGEDVVGAYAASFRHQGLKVGLYMSILDLRADIRHHNVTPAKIELVKAQLTELLTRYGPIDLLIFDGWDAPWSRITYDEVPFDEIYRLVKSHQPACLVLELNAASYPPSALFYSDIKAFEQNAGQMIPPGNVLPAQSCVTLTDGWFWKQSDTSAGLKPVRQIVDEWLVPQNALHCNLLLNAPPARDGRLAPNVVRRLEEIGQAWQHPGPAAPIASAPVITGRNLVQGLPILASTSADTIGPDMANDGDFRTAWQPDEGETSGWLEIAFPAPTTLDTVALTASASSYRLEARVAGEWRDLASGPMPGPVAIRRFEAVRAERLRATLQGEQLTVAELGAYCQG